MYLRKHFEYEAEVAFKAINTIKKIYIKVELKNINQVLRQCIES